MLRTDPFLGGIEAAVGRLAAAGVPFEHYDSGSTKTDERGSLRPARSRRGFGTRSGTSCR
jgi:hypothetical protein